MIVLGLIVLAAILGRCWSMSRRRVGATIRACRRAPSTGSAPTDRAATLTVLVLAMPQTLKVGLLAGLINLSVGVALGLVAGTGGIVVPSSASPPT